MNMDLCKRVWNKEYYYYYYYEASLFSSSLCGHKVALAACVYER